jgi:hypothetical protein
MSDDSASGQRQSDAPRLNVILRMIEPHYPDALPVFEYNEQLLSETQITLRNRRKRRVESMHPPSHSFTDLVRRHRFVCFFVVQPGSGSYYSSHDLLLRKRLATGFHDSMTLFVVSLSDQYLPEESSFMHGTGFAALGSTPVLMSLLNVTQVPTIVIIDSNTGRPVSRDSALAMEWNDPHDCLNAWQAGGSGLTACQKVFSLATFQSECTIL